MKDVLLLQVRDFLRLHYQPGKPLLLGFSGGTDSLALFHLLLECKKFFPLDLHLAHIDHGWRKESFTQALCLQSQAQELNIPFHLHQLSPKDFEDGNLEDRAREERLKFFSMIYQKIGAGALMLAHQKEDQAETVLKRVFEGAHLLSISGMREVSLFEGMTLWRPLLQNSKQELRSWLRNKSLQPIEDETNQDTRFLRARMREKIFPHLEKLFGKKVVSSLCALADQASDVKQHFEKKFHSYEGRVHQGILGSFLDFKDLPAMDCFERTSFLKFFLTRKGVAASKETLANISCLLASNATDKKFCFGKKTLFLDNGILFLCEELPSFTFTGDLDTRLYTKDGWVWEVAWEKTDQQMVSSSWREAFVTGRLSAVLPDKDYQLIGNESKPKSLLKEILRNKWAKHKVPVFLRDIFPLVIQDDKLTHEFLTGSSVQKCPSIPLKRVSIGIKRNDK